MTDEVLILLLALAGAIPLVGTAIALFWWFFWERVVRAVPVPNSPPSSSTHNLNQIWSGEGTSTTPTMLTVMPHPENDL